MTSYIGRNPLIRVLSLSQNNLFTIPAEISALGKKLQILDLSHNNLRELPEEMNHLRVLSKLNISFNRFESLPLCVSQFRSLQTLNCSHNRMQDLPDLSKFENLQCFYGDCNQFGKIPSALLALPKLKKLSLSNNSIAAVPFDITRLASLEYLDLSCNAIQDVANIFKIHTLTDLNLTHNRVAKLPKDLPTLIPAIVDLYLGHNQLTEFPWEADAFPTARQISINYNDIHCGTDVPRYAMSLKPAFFCEGNPDIDRARFLTTATAAANTSATSPMLDGTTPSSPIPIGSVPTSSSSSSVSRNSPSRTSPIGSSMRMQSMLFNTNTVSAMSSSISATTTTNGTINAGGASSMAPQLGSGSGGQERVHKVGWAETCGNRPDMQDAICVHQVFMHTAPRCLVGVYDGHSGSSTSLYVAQHVATIVAKGLANKETPESTLRQAYSALQNAIVDLRLNDGCTALTMLILENAFYVANAGDSRAVLCRGGTAIELSSDDKPLKESEYTRIKRLGGFVSSGGRVNGEISIARSLGDIAHQPFVLWEPTIEKANIMRSDEFVILACDGLWDVFSSQEAVNLIKDTPSVQGNPFLAASLLRDAAYAKGSADNISVVVVWLAPKK